MEIHKKVWTEYFEHIIHGGKKFDVRLADFEASRGDILVLKEWDVQTQTYTGRCVRAEITFVLKMKTLPFWSSVEEREHGLQITQFELLHGHDDL